MHLTFSEKLKGGLSLILAGAVGCWLLLALVGPASSWANLQFEETSVSLNNPDGSFQHQAGAHPDLRFRFKLPVNPEMLHDVRLQLPPGLVGNQTAVGECRIDAFREPFSPSFPHCPIGSQVGWVKGITSREVGGQSFYVPLFSLVHGPNLPARFGFIYLNIPVLISVAVRPGDYRISSGSNDSPQAETVQQIELDLWGVPADPAHDEERVPVGGGEVQGWGPIPSPAPVLPFLRNPTSCSETPGSFVAEGDSWENPGVFDVRTLSSDALGIPFVFEGCEQLSFGASLAARATASAPDSPSGLVVDVNVPQNETPYGQATSDVRKVVTSLPAGLAISPSSASGLDACSVAQVGIGSNDPPTCPDASTLGTVRIKSPLLEEELEGHVYLARQYENPFGSLFAIYVVAKGPGFYVKLPGKIDADPVTGQLTTTFSDTPQLPFEHFRLEFKTGPRAPLATPQSCGTFTTTGDLTPWDGNADTISTSSFAINGCPAVPSFAPSFTAGTSTAKAGAYSPLTVSVKRADGDQDLGRIDVQMPKGVLGKISSVTPCGEADANAGTCPEASRIGGLNVAAGPGPEPLYLPEPGKRTDPVYLTGPYNGGPYGLSIVTHAEAGPFNLGDVVVRASIRINPITAQVSVLSDPFPQIREGIPLRLRMVSVNIDRPGFIFNPTSCSQQHLTAAITSNTGTTADVSSPFAVDGCSSLKFAPKFTASASAAGNVRAVGARLSVKLSYPTAPAGTQANIAKVKVSLPRQLPSRLTTLQKACLASQFDANPAGCPAASIVGKAKVTTPLLSTPLTGPAYFVSHGGEAFPSLVVVLQGSGVTVQLVGKTFISHAGITSTTFDTVPDVPFNTFELELPQGKYSALGTNGNLCHQRLTMPTDYTAQNGTTLHQNNTIATPGCPRAHGATLRHRKSKKAAKA
jgi:hypothetical protein